MTVRFPQHWIGWKMLGVVFQQLGRDADALLPMRKTVSLAPGDAEAHNNLGVILQNMGRLEEAEASYRSALKINPGYAHAHGNLGATLQALRRLDEAESSYRRAIKIKPDYAKAHCNLGSILQEFGRMDEAEASYLRALQINANDADAHYFLGNMLRGQGRSQEAEKCYRQALKINPDYADAHWALGYILHVSGRLIEAETSYRRALQIKPDHVEVCSNLGVLLQDTGRLDEAETILRRVLQLNPNYAEAFSNLLFGLAQTTTEDVKSLFFEHCRFGDRFEAAYREKFSSHGNSRDPERCLQIGFVSGDLCDHAVAYFIEPVLSRLSGYSSLSLHAYSNSAMEDEVTQRMRGYFAHWNQIAGLSDVSLDEKIRADRIDILIDLSGHTARNRLLAFARKPAPLQLSWIGYPGTTGLKAMDYFLADSHFLPPGLLDDQFTEKIVRLPATAPFLPYREAPTVNSLPALRNGYVTFGTFNRLSKINRSTVALWTQLLRALPDSRMVLGGMPRDGNYDNLIAWFEQEGIARERLDGHTRGGMDAYLSLHQQVDICLDTFPYNGGTTTSHALWMGVPTLTLLGSTVPSRVGAMLLGYVGLKDFIALDNDDFVRKGQLWAGNLPELAGIRAGLRERFSESALGRPDLIAAGLERALRIMWQRWCAGMPTESFEVPQNEISDATQEADV
jgi:predicted O-linked N-acetylglucosamine transferase (SPINDLY family)